MNKLLFLLIFYLYIFDCNGQRNRTVQYRPMTKSNAKVCQAIRLTILEIGQGVDPKKWIPCEIILGSIIYAPMPLTTNFTATTNSTSTELYLPNLREVYGYILLGYSSVRSFASMFPRLSIIHGQELFNGFGLIIMENFKLDEIGLTSLINIRRGNVIIARNPQLCYSTSIEWNEILEDKDAKFISRQNRDDCAICPICSGCRCWSATQCQSQCSPSCKGNCLSEKTCCPSQCTGGCYTQGSNIICNACRKMRIYATGRCVEQCPEDMLQVVGSICVTRQECPSFFEGTGVIFENKNECVLKCPKGYEVGPGSRCVRCMPTPENDYCNNECREHHIRSLDGLKDLTYCTRVHTLSIYNIAALETAKINVNEIFTALEALEQIDHEFTIHAVNVFSTLSVFKNLKRIGISSDAVTTIEENNFLTDLWPTNRPPPIVRGNLNIVRNARLCMKPIQEFIEHLTKHEKDLQITNNTWNEYANGYLTSCESKLLTLTINAPQSSTASVHVSLPQEVFFRTTVTAEYMRQPFLSIYYKETETRNETYFDTALSHQWTRIVEKLSYDPSPQGTSFSMNVPLNGLRGAVWYAVYVSFTSNANTVGLYSKISYFKTKPRQPEPILNLRGEGLSDTSIELIWQPPLKPNGEIATYLVYYMPLEDRIPVNNTNVLCLMKDRWHPDESVHKTAINLTTVSRCPLSKSSKENSPQEQETNIDDDQVVIDLSKLEHQLVNSVTQRKESLLIEPDLKDTIISKLDYYFEDKSSAISEQQKNSDSIVEPLIEHSPHISAYNRTTPVPKIVIDGLNHSQMYMFQVYACHDLTTQNKSAACSSYGVLITVRTKPGDPSLDLVRNVELTARTDGPLQLLPDLKIVSYQISWEKPLTSNGLIYFYTIHIDQTTQNGPKDERCIGNDINRINVSLLPRTNYRLRIITYSIARLNQDYREKRQFSDENTISNSTTLYYQIYFTTIDLPNREMIRQNRLALLFLIIGSIILLVGILLGAPIYYYKYNRGDTKASISKNPNYELYTPDQWEIDKDSVTIDKLIGQGHFGQVYQGVLKLSDGTLKSCAIKIRTTHPTDLLQEASIMKQFQCYHVIQLYGICSRIRPPYVVMELMENGDLKNYLQRHRQSEINPNGPTLSEAARIQLALDIADGMYYLSDQKFVHRDLAARNCLVNGNHTCKVGDFGLTRDIYETDYYRRGGRSFLPIRWMAPESLRDGRFDTVSDVWSFGVLLWEIATLAEQPYQGYTNEEVVHYVRHGNITLEPPSNCPKILHKLMRACWTDSPGERITFRSLVDELIPYENEDFHLHAYYHTQSNPSRDNPALEQTHQDYEEQQLLLDNENYDDEDDNDSDQNI